LKRIDTYSDIRQIGSPSGRKR